MGIRTNKKLAVVHVDPFSLTAGIEVLSGNAVQVFNRDTQEYVPDRTLVPLIVLPYVNVADPHGVQSGRQTLTGVEWYEGTPKSDGSNRITDGVNYEIGTGEVEGFPKYALKVNKNVDPNVPEELFAIAIFTDKRRNTEVRVERSIKMYTAYYDAQNYSVKIEAPASWTIDPLKVKPDEKGYWKHSVTAQLYSGKQPVPDSNAAYWWEVYENDTWRPVNDDDLAVWIDCKDEAGHFTKTLTFDARLMGRTVSFRVRAAYFEGLRPDAPSSEELQATTSVKMEMPKSLNAESILIKGGKQSYDLSTPLGYEVIITYNKDIIGPDKDHLFRVDWYAQSTKPGSKPVFLGTGRKIEFIPKEIGIVPPHGVNTYADVKAYIGHSVVTVKADENSEAAVLTSGGAVVIQPVFK